VRESLSTIEKALFFKEQEFFSGVGVEELAEIAALAVEVHYEAGAPIIEQQDASEHVFIVVDGNVVIEKDGIVTNVVGAGKGFADLTFVPGSTYGFAARAVVHTHVLRISLDDLHEAMLEHPELAVGIVRAISLRLKEASHQLAALGRQLQDGPSPAEPSPQDAPEPR
jgi:CRP/FNR family transcriptional regulator